MLFCHSLARQIRPFRSLAWVERREYQAARRLRLAEPPQAGAAGCRSCKRLAALVPNCPQTSPIDALPCVDDRDLPKLDGPQVRCHLVGSFGRWLRFVGGRRHVEGATADRRADARPRRSDWQGGLDQRKARRRQIRAAPLRPGGRAYRPGAIGRCAGDVQCTLAGSSPGRIAPGLTATATARLSRANFVARLAAS